MEAGRILAFAIARVDRRAPIRIHEEHIIGIGATAAFHAGCPIRHARYHQPASFRPFGQQSLDLARRHVAFDRKAPDNRSVATPKSGGNAISRPKVTGLRHVLRLHTEAVGPQVIDPRAAAASGGPHVYGNHIGGSGGV